MSGRGLREALAVFDEPTLTALASKGLLRRAHADVEKGKVAVVQVEDGLAVLQADGEEVRMGPGGPAAATCSCPAPGVCRHRLAAVLVLQAPVTPTGTTEPAQPGKAPGGQPAEADAVDEKTGPARPAERGPDGDPVADILKLSAVAIGKWAGKATLRAAEELLAGLGEPDVTVDGPDVTVDGAAAVVRLGPDLPAVRYLAGHGLDGMVSKAQGARRKAIHVAAILALRRHHRAQEPGGTPQTGGASPLSAAPDPDYLDAVARCLADCARTALNLAPVVLEERLFALSVSSRADALPRLSSLLRTLAARVNEKRNRDFSLDPGAFLTLMAEGYAVTHALAGLSGKAEAEAAFAALRGATRQSYVPLGKTRVYGMGAQLWRTAAGARGVSGYFYAPAQDRWYRAGVVRGHAHDAFFDPRQAYRLESLWGAGPLADLARSRLVLEQGAASADGRLSLGKGVRATVEPWAPDIREMAGWPAAFDDWSPLEAHLHTRFTPSVVSPQRSPEPVLLLPSALALPSFDELAQKTVWPVRDSGERWMALTVERSEGLESVAQDVERAGRSLRPWAVAVLAFAGRERFALRPFALCLPTGAVHSLGLDQVEEGVGDRAKGLLQRLGREVASAVHMGPHRFAETPASGATERTLADAADALLAAAELGNLAVEQGLRERLARLAARLEDLGQAPVARALKRAAEASPASGPRRLLEAVFLVDTARGFLTPLPYLT